MTGQRGHTHSSLASGGWSRLDLPEQLANIGSEVDRAIRAWETNKSERFLKAFDRALELFDLTAADERWHGPRLGEILRARDEFCRIFFDEPAPESARGLQRYFFYFGLLARRPSAQDM